jgi:hypothetical protein
VEKSESISELAKALIKVQSELKGAAESGFNSFTKSRYITLADAWEAARTPLTSNGFSIIQTCNSVTNGTQLTLIVETMLLHESGQFLTGYISLTPKSADPQGVGSAYTYGRRYGFLAMLGLTAEGEDDDGNIATHGQSKTIPQPSTVKGTNVEVPCSICNKIIVGGKDSKGKLFTADQVVKVSKAIDNKPKCYDCYRESKQSMNVIENIIDDKEKK